MEEVFELLKRNKLTSAEKIEAAIMSQWNISQIRDLKDELLVEIEATASPVTDFGLTDYAFLANANMSAKHDAGCFNSSCRLHRIDQLARFSALYSDCVYLPNYFYDYGPTPIFDYFDEWAFRTKFAGDLKIITKLKPLLISGIIRFLCSGICLCPSCSRIFTKAFEDIDRTISNQIDKLEKIYAESTSATLRFVDPSSNAAGFTYSIAVNCDDDLWEHGEVFLDGTRLSAFLRKKYKKSKSTITSKAHPLSKEDIIKGRVVRQLLEAILANIIPQRVFYKTTGLKLKYLTNNNIESLLLQSITSDIGFNKYNDVIKSRIIYEMPILSGIPFNSLINIRNNEQEAFWVYRDTINYIVTQYISQRRELSTIEAKEIYEDLVKPKLNQLNSKAKLIKKASLRKATSTAAIGTGLLTFGLCGTFLPAGWQVAMCALGLSQAVRSIESFADSLKTPNEIKNDNFYFLWKVLK